jgi:predicted GNAT superfamily acetyltransferase
MMDLSEVHSVKGKRFLLKVETSHNHPDYLKYEDLRFEIWEEPNDKMPGPRNMVCENYFNDGSALFIAVYAADEKGEFKEDDESFIGFSYGFVGVENKATGFRDPNNLIYYSQYTGVREEVQEYGLGILIKAFQKKAILEIFGINTISCTFDPLTGVNAYRNIHHFGMHVVGYKAAHYGGFGGRLNRMDVPCDRLYLHWYLKQDIQRQEFDWEALLDAGYLVLSSEIREIQGKGGPVPVEIAKNLRTDLHGEFLLIEIPYDFYSMLRETDVPGGETRNIPIDWRLKSREAFQSLLERGYNVVDFQPIQYKDRTRDFYLLQK